MLNLIVGIILGGMMGTMCTCLMVAASDAEKFDDLYERSQKEKDKNGTAKD